jgi:hypothetical protein
VEDDVLHMGSIDALQKCRCGRDHGTLPGVPQPKVVTFGIVAYRWEFAVINGAARVLSEQFRSHVVFEKHYHPLFGEEGGLEFVCKAPGSLDDTYL